MSRNGLIAGLNLSHFIELLLLITTERSAI